MKACASHKMSLELVAEVTFLLNVNIIFSANNFYLASGGELSFYFIV